jgi:hypothetical protein
MRTSGREIVAVVQVLTMSSLRTSKLQKAAEDPSSLPSMHGPLPIMADINSPQDNNAIETSIVDINQPFRIDMNKYRGIVLSAV